MRLLSKLILGGCAMMTAGATHAAVTFDVLATSGGFGGGQNSILRFSGQTGALIGSFAGPAQGINDPRDIVVDSRPDAPRNRFFVNTGNAPPSPTPDNDQTFVLNGSGAVIGTAFDFSASGAGFVDPGGAVFGPNGNFFVGSRVQSTVLEFDSNTGEFVGQVFTPGAITGGIRGFVFGPDGSLFVGNGANLNTGQGGGGIVRVGTDGSISLLVGLQQDPELSPLDVILDPTGTRLIVSSQFPFSDGASAAATVRIFDLATGMLQAVLDPGLDDQGVPIFSVPRGLGIGPDGLLYASSTGNGRILRFNIETGEFIDIFAETPGLNGQALSFLITSIPEPDTWAMLIAGFAGTGLALRRRRRVQTAS